MQTQNPIPTNVTVVHRGARDAYQVSAALAEGGLLESLVTDLYWPNEWPSALYLIKILPMAVKQLLLARSNPKLPSYLVRQSLFSGLVSLLAEKSSTIPFSLRQGLTRWSDASLGRLAGRRAARKNSLLLTYSYYGYHAFSAYKRPGMLFQLHPHPASVRKLLEQELRDHPDCSSSLRQEWELSLPIKDFQRLVTETEMASHWLVASSFTRRTLVENGTPASAIDVIPYGVDTERFNPGNIFEKKLSHDKALQLLFVGRINQRKGIKYLLEALRLLGDRRVQLTICGRVVDDLSLLKPFGSQIEIRPSVSASELVDAYRRADLFVLPSVAEGFGQVLLESLACGLPVLSTTHTAAPDLVSDGIEGFVVRPRQPESLAERICWAAEHRAELFEMRAAARMRAEYFTWSRFRQSVLDSVLHFLANQAGRSEVLTQYV